MGSLSPWHLIILALLALLVFGGRGKLSSIMGDAAKGIKAFKEGMKDEPAPPEAKKSDAPIAQVQKEEEPIVR
jgi:sec-independent protein translocase protein TatA